MILRAFRGAWRRLSKRPGYTVLSVAVLGVGLGTVLFGFSSLYAMVLQPLPFPYANRMVSIGYADTGTMSRTDFEMLRPQMQDIDAIGAFGQTLFTVGKGAAAHPYGATTMTASMFAMLGVQPTQGRGFNQADEQPGAPLTVLLSDRVWRRQFKADNAILGRSIMVSGQSATVIGVMPKGFAFPFAAHLWLPDRAGLGSAAYFKVVARLKPGVSLATARAQLQGIAKNLGDTLQGHQQGKRLTMSTFTDSLTPESLRSRIRLMFGAGLLVLLLACINVANLQVVQTLKRRHELALRSALGAQRTRLLGEQLAESFVLSMLATGVALCMVWFCNGWLNNVLASNNIAPPYYQHFDISPALLMFATLAALLTTALAGLLPAWRAARSDMGDVLRDGDKASSGSGFARVAKALVVAEIALTVVLLVGAGTYVRGLEAMVTTHTEGAGDATHILTTNVWLLGPRWSDAKTRAQFLSAVAEQVRGASGVIDASVADAIPQASSDSASVAAFGAPKPAAGYPQVNLASVDSHFANTYGMQTIAGRFFNAADRSTDRPVAVVDQSLAHALWPDRSALGQRLVLDPDAQQPEVLTVVGVVPSLQLNATEQTRLPGVMVPLWLSSPRLVFVAVRTHADPLGFAPQLAGIVHSIDPLTPVFNPRTQAKAITMGRIRAVIFVQLFTAMGLIALLLAAAGLYGVLAFAVAQRTREIGIRRAIGAGNGAIVREVGRTLAWQLGLGLLVGGALALPWSSLLANPNLHAQAHDPAVFAPVLLLVIGVSVLSALVPLARALRVDPVVALRYE